MSPWVAEKFEKSVEKELEQERENQKVKWQQVNNRAYSKNKPMGGSNSGSSSKKVSVQQGDSV